MQFLVPQNIDLEDKVIGPLTLRQFIYLLIGGMIDYGMFQIFDLGLFLLLAIPISLFWVAMAFLKIQDQSFGVFLASVFLYLRHPKVRHWSSKYHTPQVATKGKDTDTKPTVKPAEISESELDKLAHVVGTRGWEKESSINANRVTSHQETKAKLNLKPDQDVIPKTEKQKQ